MPNLRHYQALFIFQRRSLFWTSTGQLITILR